MKKDQDAKALFHLDHDIIDFVKVLADFDEGVIIADCRGQITFYSRTQGKINDLNIQDALGKMSRISIN